MDIGSVIIGVGGLAVAAWTAFLSGRARTQPLREVLYQRQMDLFVDLIQVASDLHGEVGLIIDAAGGEPQQRAIHKLVETHQRHWPTNARLGAFAPSSVVVAWRNVDALVLKAIGDSHDRAVLQSHFDTFETAIAHLLTEIRAYLGTDPLTEETRQLLRSVESRTVKNRLGKG